MKLAWIALALPLSLCAKEYKIAVAGLIHSHVWGHLDKMVKGQPARLVGVAETNPDLIAEARKAGVASRLFHSDYRKMIDETKPDIVWAFVENNRHLEIVQFCAPRKVHVMFEKPLAASHKDAAAIRALARKHGIQVMTNYQMAWWPANYAAKARADAGALGQVWRLRGIVGHGGPGSTGRGKPFFDWLTDPDKNGAGALMDFECYNALWSLWYLGRPESVFARVNHLRPERFPKVEDTSVMVLHYPKGVGIFEGSWDLPRGFQDLEVFGLEGSLMVTRDKVELRKANHTQDVPLDPLPPGRGEPIANMIQAIESGKPLEGLVGMDMNVEVMEIIDAAKLSVKTGRMVTLPKTSAGRAGGD
ncbi:MAG: Gfo/Idh/MocA family protein [Bryobacteraceae bacterium]